jgi:flagellar basal body-associated protein FliL
MNRVEDFINAAKTNEMLGELLHIKKEEEKKQNIVMWILIIAGAVLAVAGIAYAVYRFLTPDCLEDFDDEDFDDEYEEDFFDEDDEEDEDDTEE